MSNAILMSGGADDIDFMIHGLFSYQLFGHTVWITTSHVCILIVMLVILIFAVIANRKIKHATEVPDGFQNVIELIVEKFDGVVMGTMGKVAGPKFVNYISTIFIFIFMSNISGLFAQTTNSRLWYNTCTWSYYIFPDPYHAVQKSAVETDLGRHVFAITTMAANLVPNQCDQ